MLLLLASPAFAYVYWTKADVLASFFPGAAIEEQSYALSADQSAAIAAQVGRPRSTYTIEIARASGQVVGYAVVDQELGQHEPIDFAVAFGPDGTIARVEILAYREAYGDGVRAAGFRAQFVGKRSASSMRAGKDIQIVSGATISSRSVSTGVKRAALVLDAWLADAAGT